MSEFFIENGVLKTYTGNEQDVVIPDGVTEIGERCFNQCSELISVTIPEGVTEVGSSAFAHCSALEKVFLPNSLTLIDSFAFWQCSSLMTIEIPDTVTWIGRSAFDGCKNLKTAKLPVGLTRIEENMFSDCVQLRNIVLPDSVTTICRWAFHNCSALKTLVLPESVEVISEWSPFGGCGATVLLSNKLNMKQKREANDCLYLKEIKLSGKDMAHILLYQSGKKWETLIAKIRTKVEDTAQGLLDELNRLEKVSKTQGMATVKYVLKNKKKIKPETSKAICEVLLKKNKAAAAMLDGEL